MAKQTGSLLVTCCKACIKRAETSKFHELQRVNIGIADKAEETVSEAKQI